MKISILTLFPEVFSEVLNSSILGRAQKKKLAEIELINIRDFGIGKHKMVDGRPYGGGAGMILRADVLAKAVKKWKMDPPAGGGKWKINSQISRRRQSLWRRTANFKFQIILMSASGRPYKQSKAQELSQLSHLVIVCGHYEGVDQRFIDKYVNEEISIGDYVLTGGEIPAMVITDSVVRLLPGVLEKPEATRQESFSNSQLSTFNSQLLEYPHYTRPEVFEDMNVPEVLLSGNHQKIAQWKLAKSIEKTKKTRPDLLSNS